MFPEVNNNYFDDDGSVFWGMEEMPPYDDIWSPGYADLNALSNFIKNIGEYCTGYVVPGNIFYHTFEGSKLTLDYNKEFVFVYLKDNEFDGSLPDFLIFKFLQFKSHRMLLIYDDIYFLIEKTDETYKICVELDKIYYKPDFFYDNIISKPMTQITLEDCFVNLINAYKDNSGKSGFNTIDDIDILIKILKLNIE